MTGGEDAGSRKADAMGEELEEASTAGEECLDIKEEEEEQDDLFRCRKCAPAKTRIVHLEKAEPEKLLQIPSREEVEEEDAEIKEEENPGVYDEQAGEEVVGLLPVKKEEEEAEELVNPDRFRDFHLEPNCGAPAEDEHDPDADDAGSSADKESGDEDLEETAIGGPDGLGIDEPDFDDGGESSGGEANASEVMEIDESPERSTCTSSRSDSVVEIGNGKPKPLMVTLGSSFLVPMRRRIIAEPEPKIVEAVDLDPTILNAASSATTAEAATILTSTKAAATTTRSVSKTQSPTSSGDLPTAAVPLPHLARPIDEACRRRDRINLFMETHKAGERDYWTFSFGDFSDTNPMWRHFTITSKSSTKMKCKRCCKSFQIVATKSQRAHLRIKHSQAYLEYLRESGNDLIIASELEKLTAGKRCNKRSAKAGPPAGKDPMRRGHRPADRQNLASATAAAAEAAAKRKSAVVSLWAALGKKPSVATTTAMALAAFAGKTSAPTASKTEMSSYPSSSGDIPTAAVPPAPNLREPNNEGEAVDLEPNDGANAATVEPIQCQNSVSSSSASKQDIHGDGAKDLDPPPPPPQPRSVPLTPAWFQGDRETQSIIKSLVNKKSAMEKDINNQAVIHVTPPAAKKPRIAHAAGEMRFIEGVGQSVYPAISRPMQHQIVSAEPTTTVTTSAATARSSHSEPSIPPIAIAVDVPSVDEEIRRRGRIERFMETHSAEERDYWTFSFGDFDDTNPMWRHFTIASEYSEKMECKRCGETFESQAVNSQRAHLRHKHNKAYLDYMREAGKEDKIIETGEQKKARIKAAKMDRTCTICEVTVKRVSLEGHNARVHDVRFACRDCGKPFFSQANLIKHTSQAVCKIVKEKKTVKCTICDKTMPSTTIYVHMQGVHKEKKFKCNDCGKQFGLKHHLAQHERSHSGEKPFKCDRCGRRYAYYSVKNTHRCVGR